MLKQLAPIYFGLPQSPGATGLRGLKFFRPVMLHPVTMLVGAPDASVESRRLTQHKRRAEKSRLGFPFVCHQWRRKTCLVTSILLADPASQTDFIRGFMFATSHRFLLPLLTVIVLSACGGGGGSGGAPAAASQTTAVTTGTTTDNTGSTGATPTPASGADNPEPVPSTASMTMTCVGGANTLCSGASVIRIDNGITLTSSGVQASGKSTNDLQTPIIRTGTAYGMTTSTGGLAQIRVVKDPASGAISDQVVILDNFNISWDGVTERPTIIETFSTAKARITMDANGILSRSAVPPSSDLNFYDFAVRRRAGTQANYANNAYFPRSAPARCTPDIVPCPSLETSGLRNSPGDWRGAGRDPDLGTAVRLHEDGDTYAGDDTPDASGNRRWLPGGDGFETSYPGFKGFRSFDNWGYRYANLGAWVTQDTVFINEWGGNNEHNKNRRGMVAFGDVTDPASVPASGSATYSGLAYGWYVPNGADDVQFFRGDATITVNFATRQASIVFTETRTFDSAWSPLPIGLNASIRLGAAGQTVANYMTGRADNGTLAGGISGRYFGPVVATGASGTGPAELGGAFTLSNPGTGQVAVGGFLARKQ
jgi:hypothetical protein